MASHYSAYHFYGVHVPDDQWQNPDARDEGDWLDGIIRDLGLGSKSVGVGHLTAGDYDHDMLFLCVYVQGMDVEVSLGEYRISPVLTETAEWTRALRMVAHEAGYRKLLPPAWITVPDLS